MSVSNVKLVTCDKCGCGEEDRYTTAWSSVSMGRSDGRNRRSMHLCPRCTSRLRAWLNEVDLGDWLDKRMAEQAASEGAG